MVENMKASSCIDCVLSVDLTVEGLDPIVCLAWISLSHYPNLRCVAIGIGC